MTNRLILAAIILGFLFATGPPALAFPALPHITPATPQLTFDQAAQVVVQLNDLWDAIPAAEKVPVVVDQRTAWIWAREILPWYANEGIIDPDHLITPTSIHFVWFPDADYAFHVIGDTGLCGTDIELNQRIITPGDPWMTEDVGLVTLAHEMAHVQGVCYGHTAINDESSAQLVSWEVLAAMANQGQTPAYVSLIADLRHRALGTAQAAALRENREASWVALEDRVMGSIERGEQDFSMRYWKSDPKQLAQILNDYYVTPISALFLTVDRGADTIDGVQLPINPFQEYMPAGTAKPLVIDDLAYLWHHAGTPRT